MSYFILFLVYLCIVDRAQGRDDGIWVTFQNAAEIATNMYKGNIWLIQTANAEFPACKTTGHFPRPV